MKVSDVIAELESAQLLHGDIEVCLVATPHSPSFLKDVQKVEVAYTENEEEFNQPRILASGSQNPRVVIS